MTIAVCIKSGEMKFGAFTPCETCGHSPDSPEDKARHLLLSDHYHSKQELEVYSESIKRDGRLVLDEEFTEEFVENYIEMDENWDLVEDHCDTLDQEELEFFERLPSHSQVVVARLQLFQKYSPRVTKAAESGGWPAAEAEFNKILEEEPQLRALKIVGGGGADSRDWLVIHP